MAEDTWNAVPSHRQAGVGTSGSLHEGDALLIRCSCVWLQQMKEVLFKVKQKKQFSLYDNYNHAWEHYHSWMPQNCKRKKKKAWINEVTSSGFLFLWPPDVLHVMWLSNLIFILLHSNMLSTISNPKICQCVSSSVIIDILEDTTALQHLRQNRITLFVCDMVLVLHFGFYKQDRFFFRS